MLPNQKLIRFQIKIYQTKRAWSWPSGKRSGPWDCGNQDNHIYVWTGVTTVTGSNKAILSLSTSCGKLYIHHLRLPNICEVKCPWLIGYFPHWVPPSQGKTRKLTPLGSLGARYIGPADQICPGDTWIHAGDIEEVLVPVISGRSCFSGSASTQLLAFIGSHRHNSSVSIWEVSYCGWKQPCL